MSADTSSSRSPRRGRLARLFDDVNYLRWVDRGEQQLAKLLGLALLLVMAAATVQLLGTVLWSVADPGTPWLAGQLIKVLGDLLNLLIAVEVLQNITSYLRRHVVQIELVLLTAMTAVARKVIVLPPGAENKPLLLVGLGVAVLSLAGAYWLVRTLSQQSPSSSTGPATQSPERGH